MLLTARAEAQVGTSWDALGARTRPPGWAGQQAARAPPQARGPVAQGGGGGKAPVTSGSRGSGREGRGSGGETTADWCARIIHTTQWSTELPAAARTSWLRTGSWLRPSGHAFILVGPPLPAVLHFGELPVELWAPSSRGCSRRKGREER